MPGSGQRTRISRTNKRSNRPGDPRPGPRHPLNPLVRQAALEIEYPHGIPRAKQLKSPAKRVMEATAQAYEEQSHAMRDHLANCRDVCGGYSDQARRRLAASAMDYNLQVMQEKEAEKRKGHTPTSGQINPWRNGAIH